LHLLIKNIKTKFIAGLAALVPIVLTFYLLRFIYILMNQISIPIVKKYFGLEIPLLGICIMFILIYLLGIFVTNLIGLKILELGELILKKVPLVSTIYITLKQITNTLNFKNSQTFQGTVYIEYPKKDLWTIAFISGSSKNKNNNNYFHLFVPTTPNPTSGFFIVIRKNKTIPTGLSVEDSLKTIISGGLLAPDINPIKDKN
jgi:uncharacterized membrane protein|tara:strand:+ start:143 stop:748 length:606 start_codon:yes stop_codon:yes gene_type:complete